MFIEKGRKRANTKDKITLAVYILLKKYPYEQVTVKQICDQACVSRMSFYRYYSSKEEIFLEYTDDRFEDFFEQIQSAEHMSWTEFFIALYDYFIKYRREIHILRLAGLQYLLLDQFVSYSKYLGSKVPIFSGIKNEIASTFISGGIFMMMLKSEENDFQQSAEEMAKTTMEFLRLDSTTKN